MTMIEYDFTFETGLNEIFDLRMTEGSRMHYVLRHGCKPQIVVHKVFMKGCACTDQFYVVTDLPEEQYKSIDAVALIKQTDFWKERESIRFNIIANGKETP